MQELQDDNHNSDNNTGFMILTSLRSIDEEWGRYSSSSQHEDDPALGDEASPSTTSTIEWRRSEGSNLDVLWEGQTLTTNDTNTTNTIADDDQDLTTALCHVVVLDSFYTSPNRSTSNSYEQAAAVALALHHLNTGDGSLIPELEGLSDRCPIRFSLEFLNMASSATGTSTGTGTNTTTSRPASSSPLYQLASILSRGIIIGSESQSQSQRPPPPCAFLGAGSSSVSIPSSILTGFRGIPQWSPTATSSDLSRRDQHPLFGRTIPSDEDNAVVYLKFFRDVLHIQHLSLVHDSDNGGAFGGSLVNNLIHLAPTVAPDLKVVSISLHGQSREGIQQTVSRIRERGYRYVWSLLEPDPELHDAFLEEAARQGLIGGNNNNNNNNPKYQWFFGDTFHSILDDNRYFEEGSVLHQAYQGVGLLEASAVPSERRQRGRNENAPAAAAAAGEEEDIPFVQHLKRLDNPADLEYLASILPPPPPLQGIDLPRDLQSTLVYGSSNLGFSVFAYEAAVAVGLGACQAVMSEAQNDGGDDLFLSGASHVAKIMNMTFTGVAGMPVSFDPSTGSRISQDVFYRVRNYIPEVASSGREIVFRDVTTHVYQNGTWEQLTDFTFAGGRTSAVPPLDLPPTDLQVELISTSVRVVLLICCALILVQAIGFGFWTARHRKSRVIMASQPFFLYTICFGIFIFGSTIIPISFDHGILDLDGSTKACTSTIWLFTLGMTTTLAAFLAKTHRINKILNHPNKFKRIKVTVRQVAAPMIAAVMVTIIILTVMTILSPPEYQLQIEGYDKFGRVSQIEGRCKWGNASPYMITLAIFDLLILMVSGWESYKARKLSTEFSESRYVYRALLSTLTVSFVGVPLIFLVEDNPNALTFVTSSIIFVTSTAILTLTFVPKMRQVRDLQINNNNNNNNSGLGSSSGHASGRHPVSTVGGPKWTVSGLEQDPSSSNYTSNQHQYPSNEIPGAATSPIPDAFSSASDKQQQQQQQQHQGRQQNEQNNNWRRRRRRSSEWSGMKILTLKSKSQLLKENERLEEHLHELQRLIESSDSIESLRTALAGTSSSTTATTTNPTTTTESTSKNEGAVSVPGPAVPSTAASASASVDPWEENAKHTSQNGRGQDGMAMAVSSTGSTN